MKNLEIALKKFCNVFGRDSGDIGQIEFVADSGSNYPAGLELSDELKFYCKHLKFDEPIYIGSATSLKLVSSNNFVDSLYGWRWIKGSDGKFIDNPSWSESWVVIGDKNGDALYVDTALPNSPVFGSIQSDRFKITDSLARFFDIYSDWMICELEDFDMEACDDDFNYLPEYLDKLNMLASSKLSDEEVSGFFKYFFG